MCRASIAPREEDRENRSIVRVSSTLEGNRYGARRQRPRNVVTYGHS